jgi:hypothetical protein
MIRRRRQIRVQLERLEKLYKRARVTQLSSTVLRSQLVELDLLRGKVDSVTRARIERLSSLISRQTSAPPPTLTSIVIGGPAPLGDIDGAIPFLLNGTNFINVLSVVFNPGNVPATGVGVDTATSTQLSGFTPALVPGTYDVVVTTLSGSFTLPGAFESWDADQIVAPAVAHVYDSEEGIITTGTAIDSWADQGSIGTNLFGAAAQRPTYAAARFGDNLRHATVWDGIDDKLTALATTPFGKRTTFAVIKWDPTNPLFTSEIIAGNANVPDDQAAHDFAVDRTGGASTMRTFDADAGINYRSPDDPTTFFFSGAITIIGITHDGATGDLRFFLNNTQQGALQNDPYGIARTSWDRLGTISAADNNPFWGEIGAVVQIEDIITVGDQAKLVAWLWGKWAARSFAAYNVNPNTAWFARDGAGLLTLDAGATIFMLGGWNSQGPGQFPQFPQNVTNEVWRTLDQGVTWAQILPDVTAPLDRFTPRHVPGAWLTHKGFMYVIGSDVYNGPQNNLGTGSGTQDVWRSTNGVDWELVTNTAAWPLRTLHVCASYRGSLYLMGGQTDLNDPTTALNDVWRSNDDGVTWVQLPNAPWTGRGAFGSPLPTHNGLLWLMGGEKYDNAAVANIFFNDVWTFDGTTWTQVLADGVAPWGRRAYHQQLASAPGTDLGGTSGLLWVINGVVGPAPGTNVADMWTSVDGVTWLQQTIAPWRTSHADGMCVLADRIISGPGNGDIGQPGDPGVGHVFEITRLGFAHP